MAHTTIFLVFFNLFFLFLIPFISSKSNSFTLKLIHRDSLLSPLYQPNISDFDHFKKHVQISKSRSLFLQQMYEGKMSKNTTIRMPLTYDGYLVTIDIYLGTPKVKQTLIFDTGAHFTWIQCLPCQQCFKQDKPIFDPRRSSSYSKLTNKDNLVRLFTCTDSHCNYSVSYHVGECSSRGIVSKEKFKFRTRTKTPFIAQLVFGCGNINHGFESEISGIFGMDKNPDSFVRQVGKHIKQRFSYCLAWRTGSKISKASILRFGEAAVIRAKNIKSLPFVSNYLDYTVNLRGISIGGERVRLDPNPFPKGCIIDTGAAFTNFEPRVYYYVRESFDRYFLKFKNVRKYQVPGWDKYLCYSYMGSFNSFPDMTYHFQGADFDISPANVALHYLKSKYFCLSVKESPILTILGEYHQENKRFLFDLEKDTLSFAEEDCSKDVA